MWNRIKEPSTWLGLGQAVFGAVLGSSQPVDVESPSFLAALTLVLTGVIGMFRKEGNK